MKGNRAISDRNQRPTAHLPMREGRDGERFCVQAYLELSEKILKVGAIPIGITYALGLLITNLYLSEYGISSFSALNVQYVLTGTAFLFFLVAPGLVCILPLILASREKQRVVAFLAYTLVSLLVTTALLALWVDFDSFSLAQSTLTPITAWRIYFGGVVSLIDGSKMGWVEITYAWIPLVYGAVSYSVFKGFKQVPWRRFERYIVLGFAIVGSVAGFTHYVHLVYPRMKSAFGGGYLGTYDLLVNNEAKSSLEAFNFAEPKSKLINLDAGGKVDQPIIVGNAMVIYQDSESVYFRPSCSEQTWFNDGEVIAYRIPRSAVISARSKFLYDRSSLFDGVGSN